jgi:hypothetical protein
MSLESMASAAEYRRLVEAARFELLDEISQLKGSRKAWYALGVRVVACFCVSRSELATCVWRGESNIETRDKFKSIKRDAALAAESVERCSTCGRFTRSDFAFAERIVPHKELALAAEEVVQKLSIQLGSQCA